jgi:hypothetical protein
MTNLAESSEEGHSSKRAVLLLLPLLVISEEQYGIKLSDPEHYPS